MEKREQVFLSSGRASRCWPGGNVLKSCRDGTGRGEENGEYRAALEVALLEELSDDDLGAVADLFSMGEAGELHGELVDGRLVTPK